MKRKERNERQMNSKPEMISLKSILLNQPTINQFNVGGEMKEEITIRIGIEIKMD
jgi:hypothetical protein